MEIKNLNTYLKPQLTRASLVQMLSYKLGIYLAYSSLDGAPQRQSLRTELPTQVIATLVGMVATLVGQYAATGHSPLTAASHWVDLLSPFEKSEKRYWEFNASCGCSN